MIPTVEEVNKARSQASILLEKVKLHEKENKLVLFKIKKNLSIMVKPSRIETKEQRDSFIRKYQKK